MKSRKLKMLAIVLVISILAVIVLPACSLIRLNEDRVANEALIEVKKNGITIEVTKNEILDQFYTVYNQYAQYIQQGYYGVDEILKGAIEGKIQSAYLLTEAMPFLVNKAETSDKRFNSLVGGGKAEKPVDVLTFAEKSLAVYSVNKNMDDSIEQLKEEAKIKAINKKSKNIEQKNIKELHFTDETKAYLQDVYYVGYKIDRARIVIYIEYKDGSKSAEFPVASSMFKTEFSSAFGEDNQSKDPEAKKIEIIITEEVGTGENVEKIENKLEHKYTLKAPRATKNDPEEDVKLDAFKIEDVEVGRYDTIAELKAKGAYYEERDFNKEFENLKNTTGSDAMLIEGYEDLLSNLERGHKTVEYYYETAYKTTVVSALQAELGIKALNAVTEESIQKEVLEQFDFLYESAKKEYKAGDDAASKEANAETFKQKISEKIDAMYYYPAYENLKGVFYVYNLLFKFTDEQVEFLKKSGGTGEELKAYQEYLLKDLKTKPANPNYDPEFECPLHKDFKDGATCAHEGEGICPSVPFGKIVDGQQVVDYEENVVDVMARLENELKAIYEDAEKTDEQKGRDALALFEDYMYTYSEDGGILNNSLGYYGVNDSFDKNFIELSEAVFAHSGKVGNAFGLKDDGTVGLLHKFSVYGPHMVAISFVPFANDTNDVALTFANDEEKLAYLNRTFDNTGVSYYEKIRKTIESSKKQTIYNDYVTSKTPDKYFEINEKTKIEVEKDLKDTLKMDTKKLEKILKEYLGG